LRRENVLTPRAGHTKRILLSYQHLLKHQLLENFKTLVSVASVVDPDPKGSEPLKVPTVLLKESGVLFGTGINRQVPGIV